MPQHPNVMLVVISGARADHLSCYGHNRRTTPAIDQIAAAGVRAWASAALSCETRSACQAARSASRRA